LRSKTVFAINPLAGLIHFANFYNQMRGGIFTYFDEGLQHLGAA